MTNDNGMKMLAKLGKKNFKPRKKELFPVNFSGLLARNPEKCRAFADDKCPDTLGFLRGEDTLGFLGGEDTLGFLGGKTP